MVRTGINKTLALSEAESFLEALRELSKKFPLSSNMSNGAGRVLQQEFDYGYSWVNDLWDSLVECGLEVPWGKKPFPKLDEVIAGCEKLIEFLRSRPETKAA